MQTRRLRHSFLIAVGLTLAMSLTGCVPADEDDHDDQPQNPQTTGEAKPGYAVDTDEAEVTDPAGDPFADSARTTSWASDEAMQVDADGNGTIPAASLEADLVDLFANKFDMKVKEAVCESDMEVTDWQGFVGCDVIDDTTTYFGTVELLEHKDRMVRYEIMFPGLDAGDVEF